MKPHTKLNDKISDEKLIILRKNIDQIDTQIVNMLIKRFALIKKIAVVKAIHHIPIIVSKRFTLIIKRLNLLASRKGLNSKVVKQIYETIHNEACLIQAAAIRSHKKNVKLSHLLLRLHSDRCIQSNHFAVQINIIDNMRD